MSRTDVDALRTVDFFATAEARRSVRAFERRDIEPATLDQILAAPSRAPSAGSLQAYQIALVRAPGRRRALARAAQGQAFVAEATVVPVCCADALRSAERYGRRGAELFAVQDATPLGHPAETPERTPRRSLADLVHHERLRGGARAP